MKKTTLQFNTYGNEKQKQGFRYLLDNTTNRIGYGGGAGGGKSYTGVAWQWMRRNKYPGTRGFFGRKELKNLKRTTLATYFKFLDDYKIPEAQRGVYNAQDSIIRFANGSEIHLLDLAHQPSDPLYTRFGSSEYTDGFIDESNEVAEDCKNLLYTRIGRQKNEEYGLCPKMLETFNPDKGHVYRDYYLPYKQFGTEWTKTFTAPDGRIIEINWVFIPALATDNKRLPQSYIDNLASANEVTKQRLLLGNFDYDDTPGRLFNYDKINDLWTNARQLGKKYITCDVARFGKDNTVILIWEGLHIRESITLAKSSVKETCDEIKRLQVLHEFGMSDVIVDEDGVGGGVVDTLDCKGFVNNSSPLHPYNSKWRPDLKKNYKNLKTQCYFILADYVNKNKLSIEPDYFKNELIQELDIVVETTLDDNKKTIISKEEIKEKIGRSPDYSDALMMRMWFELRNEEGEADAAQGDHNVYVQKGNLILDNILPEELEIDFNIVSEPSLNPYDENYTD